MLNLRYQYLIDWSTAVSMFVIVPTFLILFESRFPRKKYIASLLIFMPVWYAFNLGILFVYGLEVHGRCTIFTATLPCLAYFYIAARDRGGRLFFTFCLVGTIVIWIMTTTGLIDHAVGSEGIVCFVLRMIAFALMMPLAWFWARKRYLRLLHTVSRGWWLFTFMTGIFYVTLTIIGGVPTNLRLRPDDIPAAVLVLTLLPLTYLTIFRVLNQQQALFEANEHRRSLEMQTTAIEQRADEFRRMESRIRIERHDMRHRFQAVYTMLKNGNTAEAMDYIAEVQEVLRRVNAERYCNHPVLDAILTAYFQKAKEMGVAVEAHLSIPDTLPVSAAELSTVFANALENMLRAVQAVPEGQRRIVCKCISSPRLMIEFANPCAEDIEIGSDGLPAAQDAAHGTGTRSIVTFAEKHRAAYSFRMENGWFKLQLAL